MLALTRVSGDDAYVIGVDFGTLQARALVVRVRDGAEAGAAISEYPHGAIDRSLDGHGELPPDWALQDPADWTRALGEAVPAAVRDAGIDPAQVIGIATDFTASTCMPVLADGTPLCQLPGLAARPHAYPKLWKHAPPSRTRTGSTRSHTSGARSGSTATAARFPRNGSSPRRCSCWTRIPRCTSAPTGGSRPPTGSSGSCAAPRPGTRAPPGTRASTRTAATRRGSTWPRWTRASLRLRRREAGAPDLPLGARPAG